MTKMDIYIGLNDMEEKNQKFDNSKYISVLKNVCLNYNVPFSFHLTEGWYINNSGEYIQENTLILSFIGIDKTVVNEIAKDLCILFHQESVLITISEVESYTINYDNAFKENL